MPIGASSWRDISVNISADSGRPGRDHARGLDYGRLYAYRFRDVDQARRQAVWNEIAGHIYPRMGAPESVLDPAAGRGEFITAIPAADRWAVDAVSHDEAEMPGVKVVISDIMEADLPEGYFDGVFVSNFLEHLPDRDTVARFLDKLAVWMRPGGRLAILGPNFRHCHRRYFDYADHAVILTHLSVAEHLHAAGFNVTRVTSRFLPYSFQGILPPSPRLTRIYLRTPVLWRVFGKQFLVLAEKPAPAGPPTQPEPSELPEPGTAQA